MTNKEIRHTAGFFIKDVPLGVFQRFKIPCQERCGDLYWVRLKELLDKEDELERLKQTKEMVN